jgi:hypothetical protein
LPQGHPYSDLANLLQPFYVPVVEDSTLKSASHLTALRDIPAADLPIPDAEFLLKEYCSHTGRAYPLNGWVAGCSFAFFRVSLYTHPATNRTESSMKLAVITQGIAARSAKGQASSAQASAYARIFPAVGALALDTIMRGMGGKM